MKINMRWQRICEDRYAEGYLTVEATLVMSVVLLVYVFLIDCMLFQYERCVDELEAGRKIVQAVETEDTLYEINQPDPVQLLRLQRMIIQKEEEKVK